MFRKLGLLGLLGAAVAVPYAVSNGPDAAKYLASFTAGGNPNASADWSTYPANTEYASGMFAGANATGYSSWSPATDAAAAAPSQPQGWHAGTVPNAAPSAAITGPTIEHLEHLFRTDMTPQAIMASWPRVTTSLAEQELDGLRVPLVTGVQESDLTGSLTYYFDKQQSLQRITFHGTTGDPHRLVEVLRQRFQFQRQNSLGGELYTVGSSGSPKSMCRIRNSPLLSANQPHLRYEVLLEINRPGSGSGLSEMAQAVLTQDKQAKMW